MTDPWSIVFSLNMAPSPRGPSCSIPMSMGAVMFICMRIMSLVFFSLSRLLSRFFLELSFSFIFWRSSWICISSSMGSTTATSSDRAALLFFEGNPKTSRTFMRHLSKSLNSLRPSTFKSVQHWRISGVVSGSLSRAARDTSPLGGCSNDSLLYWPRMAMGSMVLMNSIAGISLNWMSVGC